MDPAYKSPKRRKSSVGAFTPARASFMSPTKASLAKFNPDLLTPSRRNSSARSLSHPTSASHPQSTPAESPFDTNDNLRRLTTEEEESIQDTMRRTREASPEAQRHATKPAEHIANTPKRRLESPTIKELFGMSRHSHKRPAEAEAGLDDPTRLKRRRNDEPVVDESTTSQPSSEESSAEILRLQSELGALRREIMSLEAQAKHAGTFLDFNHDREEDVAALLSALGEDGEQTATSDRTAPLSMSQLLGTLFRSNSSISQSPVAADTDDAAPSLRPLNEGNPVEELGTFSLFSAHSSFSIVPRTEKPGAFEEPRLQYDIAIKNKELHMTANIRLMLSLHQSAEGQIFKVDEMAVPNINRWARNEIGGWIAECCKRRDVSVLFHGLSSYYMQAYTRARRWSVLEASFFPYAVDPVGPQPRKQLGRDRVTFRRDGSELTFIHKVELSWAGECRRVVQLVLPKHGSDPSASGTSAGSTEADAMRLYTAMLLELPDPSDVTAEMALLWRFFHVEPVVSPEWASST